MKQTAGAPKRRRMIGSARMRRALFFSGIALLGSVISAGQVLYQMAPFGVAFFSVAFRGGATYALIPLFSLVALFSGIPTASVMGYGVAMLFFSLIRLYIAERRLSPIGWAAIAGVCNLVAGLCVSLGTRFLWYDAFRLLLESTLCAFSSLAFSLARTPLCEFRLRRRPEISEAMALSASVGILLLGMSDLWQIGGFHPERAAGAILVMLFAYQYGVAAAGAGVAAGFFVGLNDYMLPETMASYGLCALVAGMLQKHKKWGVALGFILSNAFLTLLLNGSTEVIIHLSESAVAALIMMLIPQKTLTEYAGFSAAEREELYGQQVREHAAREVEHLAASFRRLGECFASIGTRPGARPLEETLLFRRTAECVCGDCGMRHACWKNEREATTQAMEEMLRTAKDWGDMQEEHLPERLRLDCVRQKELCRVFSHMYELYKIDRLHARRSAESRRLTTAQIEEMTLAAERVAAEIRTPEREDAFQSARLRRALQRSGIGTEEVRVTTLGDGRLSAHITLPPGERNRDCWDRLLPPVEATLGVPVEKLDDSAGGEGSFTFCERYALSVRIETVKRRANGSAKSGDRYSFLRLPGGKFAAILCDGTGTGSCAARESRAAVKLIEALLSSGVKADTAMGLLNAAALSAGGQEIFTVCDLFLMDQTSGAAHFLKSGAAAGYVLRDNAAEIIKGGGLPAGSAGDGMPAEVRKKLLPGDRVILCSDGVGDGKKYEIKGFLEEHADEGAGHLAERLIRLGSGRDDRTVIVMEIAASEAKRTKRRKGKPYEARNSEDKARENV